MQRYIEPIENALRAAIEMVCFAPVLGLRPADFSLIMPSCCNLQLDLANQLSIVSSQDVVLGGEISLDQLGSVEKRLWGSADTLRANSNFASNEYFMPVMGLIFLRHAYSRFLKVREEIIPTLPSRDGKTRDLTKACSLQTYK